MLLFNNENCTDAYKLAGGWRKVEGVKPVSSPASDVGVCEKSAEGGELFE